MAELGELAGPVAAEYMAAADTNGDGMMTYDEFSAFVVCSLPPDICSQQGPEGAPQCDGLTHLSSASSHAVKTFLNLKRTDGGDLCTESGREAMFSTADTDGSGSVSMAELGELAGPEAAGVMAAADTNGDGMMTYDEFNTFAVCSEHIMGVCSQQGPEGAPDGSITCDGMPSSDYCDCSYDCGGSYCQCADALACCGTNGAGAEAGPDGTSGQGGEAMCEGKGYTEDQCSEVGCCQWDEECWSAVGSGSCDGGPLDLSSGPVICDTRHFSSASSHKVKAQLVKFKRKDTADGPDDMDMCSDSDRQALFSMVDADGSGSVSVAELAAAAGSEAAEVMCAADADGDGMMSYEEFSAFAVANLCSQPQCDTRHFSSASSHKVKAQLVKFKRKDSPEEGDMCSDSDRQALFSMVDVDSSGSVSLAELAAAAGSEAVAVMCAADADGDGMMSYEEFSAWAVANFCSQQGGQQEEYEWTNDGVSCPDVDYPLAVKEKFLKLTAKTTALAPCSEQTAFQNPCDPLERKVLFACWDKDSSGTITTSEMEESMGDEFMAQFDKNGDGTITNKEFNDAAVCQLCQGN